MMNRLNSLVCTILGITTLAILWFGTRFKVQHGYMNWRWQTAFGRGTPPRAELFGAIVRYAQWIARMRSLR